MKGLRTLLLFWLSLGLCVSGWAVPAAPCTDVDPATAMGSGHEHHGKEAAHAMPHHSAVETDSFDQEGLPGSCDCCDTCATACAVSVTAITGEYPLLGWFFSRQKLRTAYTGLYNDPRSHPPFRPPILTS